jgi:hypothetical protein
MEFSTVFLGAGDAVQFLQNMDPDGKAPSVDNVMGVLIIGLDSVGLERLADAIEARASEHDTTIWQMLQLGVYGWHVEDFSAIPGFGSEVSGT